MSIRDLFLFALVFGAIPFIIWHPYIGVLFWAWLGMMNPHRLTWGVAFDFQFAQVVALATLAGLLFTKDERRWKAGPEVYLLLAFVVWMTLTTLQAMEPDGAFEEWKRVMKIQLMGFVALIVLHSRRHIELLAWVITLSIAFYGIKGGLFTIITGGNYRVWGPSGSYIEDNNSLALATVMTIPLLYYLLTQTARRWLKAGLAVAMVLCVFSVLGSYSRGSLLGVGAMGVFLWLKSRSKIALGMAMAMLAPVLFTFMPESWTARMHTISEYQGEGSAEARLHAWLMLYRIANDRLFGGGFELYTPEVWAQYMPDWPTVHSAHSIYLEVLGEHGWIGLALYLLIWLFVWRSTFWIIRTTRDREDLRWAHSLTSMIQASLVGFFVGGSFYNLAYWDFPYYMLILVVLMRDFVRRESISEGKRRREGLDGSSADTDRAKTEASPATTRALRS